MNDIFHTKEMKPPLLTCLTLSQHIQKSVTLALIKQGAVLVLEPGNGLRGYCIQAPNRVSHMRRDEGAYLNAVEKYTRISMYGKTKL